MANSFLIKIKTFKDNGVVNKELTRDFVLDYDTHNKIKIWFMDLLMDQKITISELEKVMLVTNLISFNQNMELNIKGYIHVTIESKGKT